MRINGMTGPAFWHGELPKEIDRLLAGREQNLDLPEEFEVAAPMTRDVVRATLLGMVTDYEPDLQGVEVTSIRVVDGQQKGVGRKFNIRRFRRQVSDVNTVADVAEALVKIASFYAPDYGKVGHPCHQWCPVWGSCPDIQQVAITSLIQHFCTAYGEASA